LKKIILIQKDDFKSRNWALEINKIGVIKMLPLNGSALYTPFTLLKYIVRSKKPNALILRYLNDYKSFSKSIIRFFTDTFSILLVQIFNIRLYWICHNIDKESTSFYPRLTEIRRSLLKKYSIKIFVTDDLLVHHAERYLKKPREHIVPICFGEKKQIGKDDIWIDKLKLLKDENKTTGLWIGSICKKNIKGLEDIIEWCEMVSHNLQFIVIGPNYLDNDFTLIEQLKKHEAIIFIEQYLDLSPSRWNEIADFIYKVYDDISVPHSVYSCASSKLPFVTKKDTFLGEMIEFYKIGFTIDSFYDISQNLNSWEENHEFNKSWKLAAERIYNTMESN